MILRSWWRRLLGPVVIASMACTLWAAALLICPKCGTEADGTAMVCPHCGAALPVIRVAAPAATNVPPPVEKHTTAVSDMALTAVHADVHLANESLSDRPELAYAYFENALAVSRLVNREGMSADAGKVLAENLEHCRNLRAQRTRTCTTCNGTGRYTLQLQALSGDRKSQPHAPVSLSDGPGCPVCGGRGVVPASRLPDELRMLIARGRRDFVARQQAIGYVACGRVWMPPDLLALLDVKAQALVRTACPTPCSSCMGSGLQNCNQCKGSGKIKCSNEGCVLGWITHKDDDPDVHASKKAQSHKEICPVCQGTGRMTCPDCQSLGVLPCKVCNGTGRNVVCAECGGQGYGPCPKCQGTGRVGNLVCPECQGKGERLCPKCHGEGCALK